MHTCPKKKNSYKTICPNMLKYIPRSSKMFTFHFPQIICGHVWPLSLNHFRLYRSTSHKQKSLTPIPYNGIRYNLGVRDGPDRICCPWVCRGWDLDALGKLFHCRSRRPCPLLVIINKFSNRIVVFSRIHGQRCCGAFL